MSIIETRQARYIACTVNRLDKRKGTFMYTGPEDDEDDEGILFDEY